ncbi:hypothetical protein BDQ17DRAFT_1428777 [Cyathus striatus]|nr:hypothetical protein BDQ17DRAFT_1428777 [Cyathus striatus]
MLHPGPGFVEFWSFAGPLLPSAVHPSTSSCLLSGTHSTSLRSFKQSPSSSQYTRLSLRRAAAALTAFNSRPQLMAQPVFDEHPLGEYFRDAGDDQDIMPGSSGLLEQEVDTMRYLYQDPFLDDEEAEWRPQFLIQLTELLHEFVARVPSSNSPSPFIERFKYVVISSTLLGSSLPSGRIPRTPTPRLPGKLDHSRSPSLEEPESLSISITPPEPFLGGLSVAAAVVAAICSAGYPLLSLFLAAAAFLMYHMKVMTDTPKTDMTPSLETLNDLIAANSIWESVVQDAITTLEMRNASANLYGPSSPSAASSSVRIALHSSLQTTQTQCDSVREIFSALTCPSELSQLSEMYAPPSPLQASFSAGSRPLSLPTRRRTSSAPTSLSPLTTNKRATWNGSYTTLAQAGSPTTQVYKRREKHRSNLSAILHGSSSASKSAPVTPSSPGPSQLNQVREDDDAEEDNDTTFFSGDTGTFGTAALELQRSRRRSGLEALRSPPPSYLSSFEPEAASPPTQGLRNPRSPRTPKTSPTLPSSSRFTALQSPRHPLSLSSIQYALQGALASKRYACSHLLALRFTELEDELYWENVRSVMSLLTTTLADASSRLADALDDVENQKIEDQVPTPVGESGILFTALQNEKLGDSERKMKRKSQDRISFAPMPSHLSRFAAHVASINSALDDAREMLEECSHSPRELEFTRALAEEEEEHAALQAYERLRRELGVALRECERGRARLIEIIHPPEPVYEEEDSIDDTNEPTSRAEDADHSFTVASLGNGNDAVDDANPYLLLAVSAEHLHLKASSREERIKLMKAKRESAARGLGAGSSDSSQSIPVRSEMERWGPGGEVVQELKDVIWKVGERRRKMKDGQLQNS